MRVRVRRLLSGVNSPLATGTVGKDGLCSALVPYANALCVDSHPQPNSITISIPLQATRRDDSGGKQSHHNGRLDRRLVISWPLPDFPEAELPVERLGSVI